MEPTTFTQFITNIQPEYWCLFVFLGAFLLGETAIITSFTFSALAPSVFIDTFLFALLGTIVADLFWYLVATHFFSKTRFRTYFQKETASKKLTPLLWVADQNPSLVFLCIKFLVGIRILLSLAIVIRTGISLRKFLFFDTVGALVFIAILSIIGSLAGAGISLATSVFELFTITVTTIIFLFLLSFIVSHIIQKFLVTSPALFQKNNPSRSRRTD